MAKTTAQIITDLESARDAIIDAFITKGGVKSLEIRGRVVTYENFTKEIQQIESLIDFYNRKAAGTLHQPARNRANLKY